MFSVSASVKVAERGREYFVPRTKVWATSIARDIWRRWRGVDVVVVVGGAEWHEGQASPGWVSL